MFPPPRPRSSVQAVVFEEKSKNANNVTIEGLRRLVSDITVILAIADNLPKVCGKKFNNFIDFLAQND